MPNAFNSLRRTALSLGLVTVGILSTLGALSLTHIGPVQAQTPGVSLAALQAKMVDLQSQVDYLKSHPTPGPKGDAGAEGPQGIQGPQGKSPFTVRGKDVTLSGYNLHIVDGTGSTARNSGFGNVIIGYNATRNQNSDVHTGSHNLILGDANNYSCYGGLIAGYFNTISGPYASVSGGYQNIASGDYSSVSNGLGNRASSRYSSVSGGQGNVASNESASVSGGSNNTASGAYTSVSGGFANMASGTGAWVSGGESNNASGLYSSISGGVSNNVSGNGASVSGGQNNNASGRLATISGGSLNTASGGYSSISGGNTLTQSKRYGWTGGSYHTPRNYRVKPRKTSPQLSPSVRRGS